MKNTGLSVSIQDEPLGLLLYVSETKGFRLPKLHIVLFLMTLVTMFLAPVMTSELIFKPTELWEYLSMPGVFAARLEFTIALILILLFHEFGHYLAGRRRGVLMSLPYFLPAPNIAGTFGAIIKSKTPITNRRDLIEVGAAGPVAGFIVSVIAIMIGLGQSQIVEAGMSNGLILGESLLLKFLVWLMVGPIPENSEFLFAPAAFAGWVGLLVTMLNLLPLGQLDGGHIIYGLFGKLQHTIARMMAAVLIGLGFWWYGWWFFGALVLFFGLNHPRTIEDDKPIGWKARLLGIIAIIIFIISFIPTPFSFQ